MSEEVSTYSWDQVGITLAGFDLDKGVAEGSVITVERDTDSFSEKVGSDGTVIRSRSMDKRATVTIKVLQSSTVNTYLSALLAADESGFLAAPGLPGKGPWEFALHDRFSGAEFHSAKAWVVKPAKGEFGSQATDREWKIKCAALTPVPIAGAPDLLSKAPPIVTEMLGTVANAIESAAARLF